MKPPPLPADPNTEVYVIPATREWFLTYEEYLARMDYYKTPKFVCEITGNSCLTYFEALQSEEKEIVDVERNCPEALREHILRFLQFNRITRLDLLVDKVYLVFKNEYFPGETIFIKNLADHATSATPSLPPGSTPLTGTPGPDEPSDTHTKQRATIREKVQYAHLDSVTTKYLVIRLTDSQQLIVTPEKILRDRNHFNKWLIKTFIKLTMSRSTKVGAPWVVKEKYAKKYRIPQEYPEDLRHFASLTPNGEIKFIDPKRRKEDDDDDDDDRPRVKRRVKDDDDKDRITHVREESHMINSAKYIHSLEPLRVEFPPHHIPEPIKYQYELDPASITDLLFQPLRSRVDEDMAIRFDIQRAKPMPKALTLPENAQLWNEHLVKEYEEELEDEGVSSKTELQDDIARLSQKHVALVGSALQLWVFLNVYHKVLKIDTFTFDDFMFAMGWNLEQYNELGRCELLDEIWCAMLGAIVSNEIPTKQEAKDYKDTDEVFGLLVEIPEDEKEDADDDEADDEGENDADNDADNDEEVNDKEEDSNDEKDDSEGDKDTDDSASGSNARAVMNHRNTPWHERVRKRNFKDGNWQCCVLGVLSLVEHVPQYKSTIESTYAVLAPKALAATPTTVLEQFYEEMDIDLKIRVMGILVDLLLGGEVVREHIDDCLEQSASLRRQRLDNIKDYKAQLDKAQRSNVQVYDIFHSITDDLNVRRPRLNLRSEEMTPEEAAFAESKPEFKAAFEERNAALVKLEQLKKERRVIERRLVELDCQRVKLLGKDRLFNRYWWFENNGLPTFFGGTSEEGDDDKEDDEEDADDDADDEALSETYLMGRLWVQGPNNSDLGVHLKSNLEETEKFLKEANEVAVENGVLGELVKAEATKDNVKNEFVDGVSDSVNSGIVHSGTENGQSIKSETNPSNGSSSVFPVEMDYSHLTPAFKRTVEQMYQLRFSGSEIVLGETVVMTKHGSLTTAALLSQLLPMQRKIIEELPDPLMNNSTWRFYDRPSDIDRLLEWLNPWGKRESQLLKELRQVKDVMVASMEARLKALHLEQLPEEEVKLRDQLTKLSKKVQEIESSSEADDQDEDVVTTRRGLRSMALTPPQSSIENFDVVYESGSLEEKRELVKALEKAVVEKRQERELQRVVEWVNSSAMEEFEKSLYDGGDKPRKKR